MFRLLQRFLHRLFCLHADRQVQGVNRDPHTWAPRTVYHCPLCGHRWSQDGLPYIYR